MKLLFKFASTLGILFLSQKHDTLGIIESVIYRPNFFLQSWEVIGGHNFPKVFVPNIVCSIFPRVNQFLHIGNYLGWIEPMFLGIFLSPGLPQILRISWGLNLKKRVWDEFSGLEVSQKFIPIKSQNFLLPGR